MPAGHLYVFFEKCLFRSSAHFFEWVVCLPFFFLDIKLYKLFVYFRSQSFVGNIVCKGFFQSVGCLFILFMVSFAVQKYLSLIRPHLFVFVFISITLEE